MIWINCILVGLLVYSVCYHTPLRYKFPFNIIEGHYKMYDKNNTLLTFNIKREKYFGIGVTYNNDLNDQITYDANGMGHYSRQYEFNLMLTWVYFKLKITKPWKENKGKRK